MDISFQNVDKVSGVLTIKIEKNDYQEKVDKSLKTVRQKAQMNGFRQGMVPMGLVKKMYGTSVLSDEINKILSEKIFEYIKEKNLKTLGEPLTNEEKQKPIDFDASDTFEFVFDIALAPDFKAELTKTDKVNYYTIEVTDKMVDDQINTYKQRNGKHEPVDSYKENDMLKGTFCELDENGAPKADGIVVEDAVLMPVYIKNDDQKLLFKDAKVKDVVVFNPNKAFDGNEAEISSMLKIEKSKVAELKSDFSYEIKEITRFVPGELTQEIFDEVYGKGTVKTEEEFRAKVKESLAAQLAEQSDYRLLIDGRQMLEDKIGKLEFPDKILKRLMLMNNKDKDEKYIDENYDGSIKVLEWQLIKEQLVETFKIKVENEDVSKMAKEVTRSQFAQYGMMNVPQELIDQYATEMLKKKESVNDIVDRVVENKLAGVLKENVTLVNKNVSMEDFNKLFEAKK